MRLRIGPEQTERKRWQRERKRNKSVRTATNRKDRKKGHRRIAMTSGKTFMGRMKIMQRHSRGNLVSFEAERAKKRRNLLIYLSSFETSLRSFHCFLFQTPSRITSSNNLPQPEKKASRKDEYSPCKVQVFSTV